MKKPVRGWSFRRTPGDDDRESAGRVPAGFRLSDLFHPSLLYGEVLTCRSCGAVVSAEDWAVDAHLKFHLTLGRLAGMLVRDVSRGDTAYRTVQETVDANFLRDNNPFITVANAGCATVGVRNRGALVGDPAELSPRMREPVDDGGSGGTRP